MFLRRSKLPIVFLIVCSREKKEELLLAMSFSHKAMTLGLLSFLGKPELVLVLYQQDILEECPVGTSQPLAP